MDSKEDFARVQAQRREIKQNQRKYALVRVFKRTDLDQDGYLTKEEVLTSLCYDSELRKMVRLEGHGFAPGAEEHTR